VHHRRLRGRERSTKTASSRAPDRPGPLAVVAGEQVDGVPGEPARTASREADSGGTTLAPSLPSRVTGGLVEAASLTRSIASPAAACDQPSPASWRGSPRAAPLAPATSRSVIGRRALGRPATAARWRAPRATQQLPSPHAALGQGGHEIQTQRAGPEREATPPKIFSSRRHQYAGDRDRAGGIARLEYDITAHSLFARPQGALPSARHGAHQDVRSCRAVWQPREGFDKSHQSVESRAVRGTELLVRRRVVDNMTLVGAACLR